MDVRQCKHCKKLFQYMGKPLCPRCVDEMNKIFEKVKSYIYENPHASLDEICEETEANYNLVRGWIREGRLILSSAANNGLIKCDSCGRPINSGRMCEMCLNNMKNAFSQAAASAKPPEPKKPAAPTKTTARMHLDVGKKDR